MSNQPKSRPIVTRGILGWGNRKNGTEAYGPGGRWGGGEYGHLLGDHLEELGLYEGTHLIIVAVPSRFDSNLADNLSNLISATIDHYLDVDYGPQFGEGD